MSRPAVPKRTVVKVPLFHSAHFFLAILGTAIVDHARSCMIQDGGTWGNQEEEATRDISQYSSDFTTAPQGAQFENQWFRAVIPKFS